MKKIGIITFHASHNCGSIMQSYALQKVISKKLNCEAEIINFSSIGQQKLYSVTGKNKNTKQIIKNIILLPVKKQLLMIHKDYEIYINNNLRLSKKKYTYTEDLKEIENHYDAFICGSDQIWNIKCPDYDDAYFLPSVTKKTKIAYAPSFGAMRIEKYTTDVEKYQRMLDTFTALSIREFNGKKWLQELSKRKVELVLDPTLLLDCEDYLEIEDKSQEIKQDYIFYYSPCYDKKATKVVDKISKKYNMPVVVWNAKEWIVRGMIFRGYKTPYHQNPGIYLNMIRNAKIVFTTSFHGAIFSTHFRKKFWVLKVGGMKEDDDRVYTLLKQLGLLNRFLEVDNYDINKIFCDVDYNEYEKRLKILREKSMEFLSQYVKK